MDNITLEFIKSAHSKGVAREARNDLFRKNGDWLSLIAENLIIQALEINNEYYTEEQITCLLSKKKGKLKLNKNCCN